MGFLIKHLDRYLKGSANVPPPVTPYFKVKNVGNTNATINFEPVGTVDFKYSIDSGTTWNVWQNIGASMVPITLEPNKYVWFKGTNDSLGTSGDCGTFRFYDSSVAVEGNIMTLLQEDNPTRAIYSQYAFRKLFYGQTNLVNAYELVLPAVNADNGCYMEMFANCTNLTHPPVQLPKIQNYPSLAYEAMFSGCTSLQFTPAIESEYAISNYSMANMFAYCSSLNTVFINLSEFDTTESVHPNWLYGVAETGTFYCPRSLGSNKTIRRGASFCPNGWTVINSGVPTEEAYVQFTAKEDNSTIYIQAVGNAPEIDMLYSLDGNNWEEYPVSIASEVIICNTGESVYFKGNDNARLASSTSNYNRFVMDGDWSGTGDLSGLLTGFANDYAQGTYTFCNLFRECADLTECTITSTLMNTKNNIYDRCFFGTGFADFTWAPTFNNEFNSNTYNYCMFQKAAGLTNLTLDISRGVTITNQYLFANTNLTTLTLLGYGVNAINFNVAYVCKSGVLTDIYTDNEDAYNYIVNNYGEAFAGYEVTIHNGLRGDN